VIELTDKQSTAWKYLFSDDELISVLYGGAKGGGKSFFLCVWACLYAKQLAKDFNLSQSDNPIPVGFLGRKRAVDFNNTTLATWKRVIPREHYEIKEQKKLIVIDSRVAIQFGGLDDQDAVNKFNSAEFVFAGIDQAEETEQADISVLAGSLRLKINGIQPKYRLLYTANPAECWLKGEFDISKESVLTKIIAGYKVKNIYIPALYTDNKHLPQNYTATLEMAFGYDEALLHAYKSGDWSLAHDSDFVITRTMLDNLKLKTVLPKEEIYTAGLDPSIGGDECVAYVLRNGEKIAEKITHETNPMIISGDFVKFCIDNIPEEYRKMCKANNIQYAGIDSCGLGIGIAQRCRDLGLMVRFIQSSEKSIDQRCKLVRDEVWLSLRERIQKNQIPPIMDSSIVEQITKFKFKQGEKFKVLSKQGVKDKLGQSPDRADAFAYAVYMMQFAEGKISYDRNIHVSFKDSYDWRSA
jgi:phage terminase large subunit